VKGVHAVGPFINVCSGCAWTAWPRCAQRFDYQGSQEAYIAKTMQQMLYSHLKWGPCHQGSTAHACAWTPWLKVLYYRSLLLLSSCLRGLHAGADGCVVDCKLHCRCSRKDV
jgi:hypothetical protein